MKRLAFLLLALCLVNMAFSQDHVHPGEPKMTQPNTTLDTLEKFNDPRNFFATRPTFDIKTFNKNKKWDGEYRFVRKDGVRVRQSKGYDRYPYANVDVSKGYEEELSRLDSHYKYRYSYYRNGRLQSMNASFCNHAVGEGLYFDKAGNIIERKNFDENFLSIEKLRERFLEQTLRDKNDKSSGIDIYDVANVMNVSVYQKGQTYFTVWVRKTPNSSKLTGYLLDALTGEILYRTDTSRTPKDMTSYYHLTTHLYTRSVQYDLLRVSPDDAAPFVPFIMPTKEVPEPYSIEVLSRQDDWEEVRLHYRFKYSPDPASTALFDEFVSGFRRTGRCLNERNNFVESKNLCENFLPVKKLRERFLEQTQRDKNDQSSGIDIYDGAKVGDVFYVKDKDNKGRGYFNVLVKKTPDSGELMGYLLDGSTGEILYKTDVLVEYHYLLSTYYEYLFSLKGGSQ